MERTDSLRLWFASGARNGVPAGHDTAVGTSSCHGGTGVGERSPGRGAKRNLPNAAGAVSRRHRGGPRSFGGSAMTPSTLRLLLALLTMLGVGSPVIADEFRPAYLRV